MLQELLKAVIDQDASDLYLKFESVPMARVNGHVKPIANTVLNRSATDAIARSMLGDERWKDFMHKKEMNLSYAFGEYSRFRVNIYYQRGSCALVFRRVKLQIPTVEELGLPTQLNELALHKKGLVLVTGPTGSGKSTSLAAMLNYRNQNQAGHIITIEDPIEYLHPDRKSIVSQREVGIDTASFHNALKNALRQAPDVISIGEIRDMDTASTALTMAETGHLVLATLHATNTYQSLERLAAIFSGEREQQMLLVLSLNLNAVISQRLLPLKDDEGRIVATELLINNQRVKNSIREGEIPKIKDIIRESTEEGMHTFDSSIFSLFEQGKISKETALSMSDTPHEIEMQMKGFSNSLHQI